MNRPATSKKDGKQYRSKSLKPKGGMNISIGEQVNFKPIQETLNTKYPKRVTEHAPYVDTSSRRRLYVHVPKEVDEVLIQLVTRYHPQTPRFIDHYRFIIHSICFQRFVDRRMGDPSLYVPLNMKVLRSIISQRNAASFISILKEEGILDVCGSYKPSEYSRSYRIAKKYWGCPIEPILITDKGLVKKFERFRTEQLHKAKAKHESYAHVERWVKELKIDSNGAREYTEAHYADLADKREARLRTIQYIELGQFWFTVDETAGRAHHNFSSLAADLRQFITIQGESIHQVDISSSQPWLLHLHLRDRISNEVERMDMEGLLLSGHFYEAFGPSNMTREDIKEKFYQMMFGQVEISSAVAQKFRNRFPSYAIAMDRVKQKDYKVMASLLQKAEAEVVFDAVQRFVQAAGIEASILTVHDSLATTPKHLHTARDALVAAFQSRYGIVPMLKDISPFELKVQQKPNKQTNTRTMNNNPEERKKSSLTCISIEHAGFIAGNHAKLIRYAVKFLEGIEGEYWAKFEESKKHFPLNERHWYKYWPLTKIGVSDTWKFAPCKKSEIPEVGDPLPNSVKPQEGSKRAPAPVGVPIKFSHEQSIPLQCGVPSIEIESLRSAVRLAKAGKIGVDKIEETARGFKSLIRTMSEEHSEGKES